MAQIQRQVNCSSFSSSNLHVGSSVPPGEQPLEVFAEKFADEVEPLAAETFDEVADVILEENLERESI